MQTPAADPPASIDATRALLEAQDYVADRALATAAFLALRLERPLFLEGEAGVGKTEIAKALAAGLDRPLIRLQCYEGLDMASAAYEWSYQRQMLEIRLAEGADLDRARLAEDLFSRRFLLARPLLRALERDERGRTPVLLIDEVDRADEPFEAFLLEVLSDFQITIPELGTIRAEEPPLVVLTSNRTREIHDALKRRCLYHWVDYPTLEREKAIVAKKARGVSERLAEQVAQFVQSLRERELFKAPGVAESIDWAMALSALDTLELDPEVIDDTLGALLKYQDDVQRIRGEEAARILAETKAGAGAGADGA